MRREHLTDARAINCPDPVNLNPWDRFLFTGGKTMNLHDRSIETHHDAHVYGRGPLWSDGEYLVEWFVMPGELEQWRERRKHWRDGVERLFQPTREFDGTALWITDNWSFSYFHWMCDALPRLESLLQHRTLSDVTLLLPAKARRCGFIPETLKAFGLKNVRILGRFEHLRCRELLVPTHIALTGRYDPEIMDRMRNRFVDHCRTLASQSDQHGCERLYISRKFAAHRKVENEEELIPILKKFGFQVLHAEHEPWHRQIELASNANVLISNHGAGLTNMVAMAAGSKVLEIRDQQDEKLFCYYTLASAMNLHYYYALADRANRRAKWNRSNMTVDPAEFCSTIEQMIEDKVAT